MDAMTPSPRESAIVGWTASLEDKSHVMRYDACWMT
jgi:hypothetical protein